MTNPAWLPPLLSMSPWNEAVLEHLYSVFKHDFVDSQPVYAGAPVWHFPECERGKETLFWHMTEHEDPPGSGNRNADFRRCERLCWARAVIDHVDDPAVTAWDYEEGKGDVHTYLWLEDLDYVVILKRYPNGKRRLLTAFYVAYESKRRNLRARYANRLP